MCFLTKQEVQHALQQYHVNQEANYKTQLLNPTKLIVICDNDSCAWRCKASHILASKQWEIRKVCEPHTFLNPSISQDLTKLSYLLISKSIHNLIENDPSTSVPTLVAHIKSTEGYTAIYHKVGPTKQKVFENIYDNWERSFHNLSRLLQVMQQFFPGMVVKETLPMPPQGGQSVEDFLKFHNLIWSFKPYINEFQYCKPVVQVDGMIVW